MARTNSHQASKTLQLIPHLQETPRPCCISILVLVKRLCTVISSCIGSPWTWGHHETLAWTLLARQALVFALACLFVVLVQFMLNLTNAAGCVLRI